MTPPMIPLIHEAQTMTGLPSPKWIGTYSALLRQRPGSYNTPTSKPEQVGMHPSVQTWTSGWPSIVEMTFLEEEEMPPFGPRWWRLDKSPLNVLRWIYTVLISGTRLMGPGIARSSGDSLLDQTICWVHGVIHKPLSIPPKVKYYKKGLDGVRDKSRVSAIEYHEWASTHGGVDPVVVGKLGNGEPIAPVGLSVGDEEAKVSLELLVNSFEVFHECGYELGSSIRDDNRGHAMLCIDMISEYLGPSLSREFYIAGDWDYGFGEMVDYDKKGVIAFGFR
ncbi:hypothetical protein F5146DRAFT_1141931 [Armillaria mellea]|nr:hypothetical protein F5146DRAFT_1141931 [Armillaria mellea]